jgi:anti-sigma factor RsiW
MSRAMDDELSPARVRRLARALEADPSCASLRRDWEAIRKRMRAHEAPAGPTPEAAWREVRRRIRLEAGPATAPEPSTWLGARTLWAGGLAAVCVLGLALSVWWLRGGAADPAYMAEVDGPGVEWVETDLPGAASMVYRDEETGCTVIWILADGEGDEHVDS